MLASVFWFQVDATDLPDLADHCLDGYIAGLRDVGWQGDLRLAQVGFVVAGALHNGPFIAAQAAKIGPEPLARSRGCSTEEFLACWAAVRRFAFDRVDAARGLSGAL